jgi:hypothetical protein
MTIVPADWPRERLIDLCRQQAAINLMPTALVLGPADAVFVDVDRDRDQALAPAASTIVPFGLPVVDRIRLSTAVEETPEMAGRQAKLRMFAESRRAAGYIVGDNLEGGRAASPDDVVRLSAGDMPMPEAGLATCGTCGERCGELLEIGASGTRYPGPHVLRVDCRCANHNRCARCGGQLADHRLSSYFWADAKPGVWYVAAYAALSHRCKGG